MDEGWAPGGAVPRAYWAGQSLSSCPCPAAVILTVESEEEEDSDSSETEKEDDRGSSLWLGPPVVLKRAGLR